MFNNLVPDHDADAYRSPHLLPSASRGWFDRAVIQYLCAGLNRWDSHYFVTIAHDGYEHDQHTAFLPLYPLCVRVLAQLIHAATFGAARLTTIMLLVSLVFNVSLFIVAAISLYHLTHRLFNNKALATTAALYFCYNPASIFFTANYSETLFACLTFSALLCVVHDKFFTAAVFFGLSTLARSNGIVSIGFLVHRQLQLAVHQQLSTKSKKRNDLFANHARRLIYTLILTAISLLPLAAYQWWCWHRFCVRLYLDWCPEVSFTTWPYSLIQRKYWNVGAFRYYELRQAPNFLLAAPIVGMIVTQSYRYIVKNMQIASTLGLAPFGAKKRRSMESIFDANCFVYFVHVLFLTVFAVLMIHVQVITRLVCSSSPCVYWFAACSHNKRLIRFYFAAYVIVGTFMHSNFLPWT